MNSKKRRRVTLQDVAQAAGVSRATASLIVRGSPKISAATREKVLGKMNELGYVYDRVAANLRSKQSTTVGLLITEIANPFFSELLDGITAELEKEGYTIILGTTSDSYEKQERLLATMLENRVAGILWTPVSSSTVKTTKQLVDSQLPVVQVGREITGSTFDYVGIDNRAGADLVISYLVKEGHRRIAYLGGPSASSPWRERISSYKQALLQAGLEVDSSLIVESVATREGGRKAMAEILKLESRPTAAFCFNDIVAIGAMQELKGKGLAPGVDMAIVGFDNVQEASIFTPRLTTVSSFPRVIGTQAAKLLHQRIDDFNRPAERIILEPEIHIRESSQVRLI
ncbi:LacI family DNA-binding transcriptional regulator [Alkalihalobacillus oceani]|uniref:LacI family DNA-binding transcriptional regulator n=1 Tax=Halalkalibacter oceani TaxID=1653776 RepID=UPI00203DA254|nr:LacI family DNA-binding transcriptional regulator [Halalkalibacter oceani]